MRAQPPDSEAAGAALPRSFYVFWLGQGLSAIGDAMTVVAMPLVVLAATGSVTQMGRLTASARVAGLVATALAGSLVDRRAPRGVMLLSDAARVVLMGLVPAAWAFGLREMWLVYVVGVGAALAQGVFYVGHVSLVAELVGRARVALANSRIEASIALAYVFGPLLAGLLSARFGPATVLGIDAATFLVSVLALLAMGSPSASAWASTSTPEVSRSEPALAGLRFVREHPELSRLTVLVASCQFFNAAIVDLFIFRLKRELGQGDSGTGVTFALAAMAAVLAAVATPRLRARLSFHRLWLAAVVLQGLALAASAWWPSFATLVVAAAIYMACMTTLLICQASIRQELTPQRLLGRVTSAYLVLVALPAPLGALAATALAAAYGAAPVQAGIGAGLLMTALLAAVIWSRMPTGGALAPPVD
jgi:MFS family permease